MHLTLITCKVGLLSGVITIFNTEAHLETTHFRLHTKTNCLDNPCCFPP